jgi:Protein of unknown function (DUF1350).
MGTFQLRREITCFMTLFLTTIFYHINHGDAYLTPLVHPQYCIRRSWRGTTASRPWNKGYNGLPPSIFVKRSEWDEEFYKEEENDSKEAKGMRSKGNKRSMYDDSYFRTEDEFYDNYNGEKYNDDYDYDDDVFWGDEDDYDDEDIEVPQNEWEWETYQKSTHVYLPPPISSVSKEGDISNNSQVPKAIIHFIGGTLFGSYPLQFYKQLLERVARLSNSIVVATSIPVTLTKNPLNHFQLAKNIAIDFNKAYRYVIVDEYGEDVASEMKIVGLGHSLGSRLQMIISTSKKLNRIGFERDGNIFIAFNNYNAYSSVPGVKRLESEIQETFNGGYSRNYNRAKYRKKSEYEIGLTDVVNAVSDGIQEQVQSFKTAITPDLDKTALEFQPTPQQLWDGIDKNYSVNKTLVVQFDQDLIDQSSRLATAILESEGYKNDVILADGGRNISASVSGHNITDVGHAGNTTISSKSSKTIQDDDSVVGRSNKDIKFARLRGTHLSPVSYSDTFVVQAIKRAGALGQDKILQEAIQEENDYRPSSQKVRTRVQNQDMENLSCAIARYVSDKIIDIE